VVGQTVANPSVAVNNRGQRWTVTGDNSSWILIYNEDADAIDVYPGLTNVRQQGILSDLLNLQVSSDAGLDVFGLTTFAGHAGNTTLSGSAGGNLFQRMLGGDLLIESVRASDTLTLTVDGSILDAEPEDGVDLTATTLNLTTYRDSNNDDFQNKRSIGDSANALELNISGLINASAPGGVFLSETGQSFDVGTIESVSGDIALTVVDADSVGQNLVVGPNSGIQANDGAITLVVGDNLEHDGRILSTGALTIRADQLGLDVGTGANIGLRGVLAPRGLVTIETGPDADVVQLQRNETNSNFEISTGAGADLIEIGSADGSLNLLSGTLRIDAGEEADATDDLLVTDRIVLDDTGRSPGAPVAVSHTTPNSGFDGRLVHRDKQVLYTNAESVILGLGAGEDIVTVDRTAAGTELNINLGYGDDTVTVGNSSEALAGILGDVNFEAELDDDSLFIDNTASSASGVGVLGSSNLSGFGLGGNVGFGGFEEVQLSLGSGNDQLQVTGTRAEVSVELGGGDDDLAITGELSNFQDELFVSGTTLGDTGTNIGNDTLTLDLSSPSTFTIDESSIENPNALGDINYEQLTSIEATLSAGSDIVEINDVGVPLNLDTGGGTDDVTVRNLSAASTIHLGTDPVEDQLTILGTDASLKVTGDTTSIDTLTVDRSATTDAVTNGRLDDSASGVLTGVTAGVVTFDDIAVFELLLGTGNDDFVIDAGEGLEGTRIVVDGGDSTDTIDVVTLSDQTAVRGGDGEDTVNIFIEGFPSADQFTDLGLTVESLAIHNSASTIDTSWSLVDASLTAESASSGGPVTVIDDILRIDRVNFFAGSGNNSLDIGTETINDVDGFVDGDGLIRTRAGIGFESVVAGQSTYNEENFAFDAGTGETFTAMDGSIGIAGGGSITMTESAGGRFDLLRLDVLSLTAQTLTVTGVSTIDGTSIVETFDVVGGNVCQVFSLAGMRDVSSVQFDLPDGAGLMDVVGSAQLTSVGRVDLNFGSIELNPGQATTFSQSQTNVDFTLDLLDANTYVEDALSISSPGGLELDRETRSSLAVSTDAAEVTLASRDGGAIAVYAIDVATVGDTDTDIEFIVTDLLGNETIVSVSVIAGSGWSSVDFSSAAPGLVQSVRWTANTDLRVDRIEAIGRVETSVSFDDFATGTATGRSIFTEGGYQVSATTTFNE
ncbi:MAG: hypothetical protein AAF802_28275, partial [Planctomycetota bacterium]